MQLKRNPAILSKRHLAYLLQYRPSPIDPDPLQNAHFNFQLTSFYLGSCLYPPLMSFLFSFLIECLYSIKIHRNLPILIFKCNAAPLVLIELWLMPILVSISRALSTNIYKFNNLKESSLTFCKLSNVNFTYGIGCQKLCI